MGQDKYDKTEAPTPKKKKESRKEGKAVRSDDLVTWLSVLVSTFVLPLLIGSVSRVVQEGLASAVEIAEDPTAERLPSMMGESLLDMVLALAPAMIALAAIAIVANLAQVGFLFTGKPLKPKISHLNPIKGIKKFFSARNLWQTAQAVVKLVIILAISWTMIRGLAEELLGATNRSSSQAIAETAELALMLVRVVAACALALGVADYAFQRFQMQKDLKMSKQEIKQENRDAEGDPMLKSKQRQLGQAISGNRILSAVNDADVIITNPTHLAVALKYNAGSGAPKVVARGADEVAAKIRKVAREQGVPIVEAKPLARALYMVCRPDEEIPPELYQGVATVLAFLHRLSNNHASMGGQLSLAVPDSWTPSDGDLERVSPARRRMLARAAQRQ